MVQFYKLQFAPYTSGGVDVPASDVNRKLFDYAVEALAEWERHFSDEPGMQLVFRTVSPDGTEVDILIDPETGEPYKTVIEILIERTETAQLIEDLYVAARLVREERGNRLREFAESIEKACR